MGFYSCAEHSQDFVQLRLWGLNGYLFKFYRGFKQVPLLGGAKPDLRKGLLRAILGTTKAI